MLKQKQNENERKNVTEQCEEQLTRTAYHLAINSFKLSKGTLYQCTVCVNFSAIFFEPGAFQNVIFKFTKTNQILVRFYTEIDQKS